MSRSYLRLPGFRPNLSTDRDLEVDTGSISARVDNPIFEKLTEEIAKSDPSLQIEFSARSLDSPLDVFGDPKPKIGLWFKNGAWRFNPNVLCPTPGAEKVRFSFHHHSLPSLIFEDVTIISVLHSFPLEFTESGGVYPNPEWVKIYRKIEVHQPKEVIIHSTPNPFGFRKIEDWTDITNDTPSDTQIDSLKSCYLVRIGGLRILPFSRGFLPRRWSAKRWDIGEYIPPDVDIFDMTALDSLWLRYSPNISEEFEMEYKERIEIYRAMVQFCERDFLMESDCSDPRCRLCIASRGFEGKTRMLTYVRHLQRLKSADSDDSASLISVIPFRLRPVFLSAAMIGHIWEPAIFDKHSYPYGPFMDWTRRTPRFCQEITVPRGGLFYCNTENLIPVWDEPTLMKTHKGWTCGVPLRMLFWDKGSREGQKVVVNWMGVSK